MYSPGGTFSRVRWDRVHCINEIGPGIDKKKGGVSRDMIIKSSKDGQDIHVRVYDPLTKSLEAPTTWIRNRKMVVFFHGGGFCIGSAKMRQMDGMCMKFASQNYVVVSISYRLAPESPFPGGIRDAYDGLKWAYFNTDFWTSNVASSDRVVVLAGDSAGGNFSCVMSSLCRDGLDADLNQVKPEEHMKINQQVLIYPALFMQRWVETEWGDAAAFIPRPVTNWFRAAYVPGVSTAGLLEMADTERRLCPFVAGFQDMPPTIIVSAGLDMLRHENRFTVQELEKAGVDVVHFHFENVPHGFATFHFLPESAAAFEEIAKALNREIKTNPNPEAVNRRGSHVKCIALHGVKGTIIALRPGIGSGEPEIATVNLGWGKAYCPTSQLNLV